MRTDIGLDIDLHDKVSLGSIIYECIKDMSASDKDLFDTHVEAERKKTLSTLEQHLFDQYKQEEMSRLRAYHNDQELNVLRKELNNERARRNEFPSISDIQSAASGIINFARVARDIHTQVQESGLMPTAESGSQSESAAESRPQPAPRESSHPVRECPITTDTLPNGTTRYTFHDPDNFPRRSDECIIS